MCPIQVSNGQLDTDNQILTLTLPGPSAGVSGSLDSYCSLKSLCSGMGEVVPARTSLTLLPPSPRNQSVRSSAPVVSRCFPGGYNVKLYIPRGRLAWWLLVFLHSGTMTGGSYCSQVNIRTNFKLCNTKGVAQILYCAQTIRRHGFVL